MIVRIRLAVEQEIYNAILEWAIAEERNPEAQIRYILLQELKKRGLLAENIKPAIHSQKSTHNENIPE